MEYQKALEGLFGVKQAASQSSSKKTKHIALKMLDNLVRTKIHSYFIDIQDFSNLQEAQIMHQTKDRTQHLREAFLAEKSKKTATKQMSNRNLSPPVKNISLQDRYDMLKN